METRLVEGARTLQVIGHGLLAFVIALGLFIWLQLAVFGAAYLLHFSVPVGDAVIPINLGLLAVLWWFAFRKLRKRAAF